LALTRFSPSSWRERSQRRTPVFSSALAFLLSLPTLSEAKGEGTCAHLLLGKPRLQPWPSPARETRTALAPGVTVSLPPKTNSLKNSPKTACQAPKPSIPNKTNHIRVAYHPSEIAIINPEAKPKCRCTFR
jgi:hypothetical protein